MAPTAFIELGLAVDLFEKGAKHSRRAMSGVVKSLLLPSAKLTVSQAILRKLRDKAFHVYAQMQGGQMPATLNPDSTMNPGLSFGAPGGEGADELAIFGGQTRVLVSKMLGKSPDRHRGVAPDPESTSTELSPFAPTEEPLPLQHDTVMADVHPSVADYMALFPPSAFAPDFNEYPLLNSGQSPSNSATMNGLSSFNSVPEIANYNYPPLPDHLPQSQEHVQNQPPVSWEPSAFTNSEAFPTATESFTPFDSFQAYTPTSSGGVPTPGSGDDMPDLSMMMNVSGDSGMDSAWKAFMRDIVTQDGNAASNFPAVQ